MRLIIYILLLLLLAACASVPKDLIPNEDEPLYKYQADMIVKIDNVAFNGMAVTKLEPQKTFSVRSKAHLDLLVISSCSRYKKFEKIDFKKTGWFGTGGESAKDFTYVFNANEKELEGTCPIYIQAFDLKGRTDWGYITWRTDELLPARVSCNAETTTFAGHSVCQVLAGTEQGIEFKSDIKKFEATPTCQMVQDTPRKFSFRPQKDFCYATFFDGQLWHRLTALGFERALVRGEQ